MSTTTLTVAITDTLYAQLAAVALDHQLTIDHVVQVWLEDQASVYARNIQDNARLDEVLRAEGLRAAPSEALREHAAQATLTLDEVSAALDRAGGKPLSEIIMEDRGPKE